MVDLLEHLVEKTSVNYLSDLRLTDSMKMEIRNIKPNQFTLKQWNEAIRYLCKTDLSCKTETEAKQFLLDF